MGREIYIKEAIEDKSTWFNIKRFKIKNIDFEKPLKCLDLKYVTKNSYKLFAREYSHNISENNKIISQYEVIERLYNEDDDRKLYQFYNKKNWLSIPSIINFTLEFNPFKHIDKMDKIAGFFDQYYSFSNPFVTIPNIRTVKIRTVQIHNKQSSKQEIIINVEDYIRFVDSAYEIINTKNNKPIFVPISLRMSQHDLDILVRHYLKKEYYNYWFDFEGKSVNETSLARLRYIFRNIRDAGYYDKIVSYFTNIKREILANAKEDTSPASDVLATIAGANIVGVNREPKRYIKENTNVPPEHKARIFDSESYYYCKTKTPDFLSKPNYVTFNSTRLGVEFNNQTEYFLKNININSLLTRKRMLTEYKGGVILKELTTKEGKVTDDRTTDWF